MEKKLIIVESPTKCKTIGKIVGKDYIVTSTLGHIRDLPKHRIGVDVKSHFMPAYEIPKDKEKVVRGLKSAVKTAKEVYIATDEDREGEAIGWHVAHITKVPPEKCKRITFHEITPEAIKSALKNPRDINKDLVDAQQARRILDRLVGYILSPLLSKKIYKGLSAGRVQSVAVRIIVEREREIRDFQNQEYWTVKAECSDPKTKKEFAAMLFSKGKTKFKKLDITNKKMVDEIINGLDKEKFIVSEVVKKDKKRNPQPPFITSTLQQSASRSLGFSAKQTMFIAQELYEGVDTKNEGTVGLITYMRTDSPQVADSAKKECAKFIKDEYGEKYLPFKPRVYTSKSKSAQEAHECIRPTSVLRAPLEMKEFLNKRQFALYKLIWDRFVASQMKEAMYEQTTAEITAKDTVWHANGQVVVFDGFTKVHEDEKDPDEKPMLPALIKGQDLDCKAIVPEQHFTEPPPRYNEATLIKTLESNGIGRPSTYAPTISTIIQRGYVRLEKKRFYPEAIGEEVTVLLEKHFPDIVNISFTANMEEDLDKIAVGEKEWEKLLEEFYNPFIETVNKAQTQIKSQKIEEASDKICPKCGSAMVFRRSRYGTFLACSAFPKCRYTESKESEKEEEMAKELEPCPNCGGKLIIKNSRFGKFIACSSYPKCRYTRPFGELISKNCPDCGHPMVVKISKRGKFLGCSGYPNCKHVEKFPTKEEDEDKEDK
ncbi:MAG: type I DNA topoisomerase [Elusimicrobiota bacterium]